MIKRILSTNVLPPSADASVKNFIAQRKTIIGSDEKNCEIIKDLGLSLPKHPVLSYPKIPELFKSRSDIKLLKIVQDEYFNSVSLSGICQEAAKGPIESSLNVDTLLNFLEDFDEAGQAVSIFSENSVKDPHTLNFWLCVGRDIIKIENPTSLELAHSKKVETSDQNAVLEVSNLKSYSQGVHTSNVPIIDVMNKFLCLKSKAKFDGLDRVGVANKYTQLKDPHPDIKPNTILDDVEAVENIYVVKQD